MNLIKLLIGDWCGDGHNIYESIIIQSNLTKTEIDEAFKKGSNIVGFDLKRFCSDYEDTFFPNKCIELIQQAGIDIELYGDKTDKGVSLVLDDFINIFLQVCKLGNPSFIFEKLKLSTIDIGGYGFFS